MSGKYATIDSYLDALSDDRRAVGNRVRAVIVAAVPQAREAIKYDMPAFQIDGRSFLYFAVWKTHVGLYPIYRGDDAFEALVGAYRAKTDTVQFLLRDALPESVLAEIARTQAARPGD